MVTKQMVKRCPECGKLLEFTRDWDCKAKAYKPGAFWKHWYSLEHMLSEKPTCDYIETLEEVTHA